MSDSNESAAPVKVFDFYELTGILIPGAVFLFGLFVIYQDDIEMPALREPFNLAELGLFAILAYGAGHLIQAVGTLLEELWWMGWGGKPTDWVRTGKRALLSNDQLKQFEEKVRLTLKLKTDLFKLSKETITTARDKELRDEWYSETREIYAVVAKAKRTQRINAFNRTYGSLRGLGASFLVLAILLLSQEGRSALEVALCLVGAALALFYRMHSFGRDYARELFVEFLRVEPEAAPPVEPKPTTAVLKVEGRVVME